MKRVLVLGSVASMIDQFNIPAIELLIEMGYQVDVACNFKEGNTCSDEEVQRLMARLRKMKVRYFHVDFARDVTKLSQNMKAFRQVERLLKKNNYVFLHCHTPIGGVVGRISGKLTNTKVIYTAHGFHFYKGAPLQNWLLFYPVEWLCAHWTDVLITINKEDYERAKRRMKAKKIVYIPGVGVDLNKFGNQPVERALKRQEIGVPENAVMLFSVGELNENKNHETVIKALQGMDVYYVIAGRGKKEENLKKLAQELGMGGRVKLLGFRTDIVELDKAADAFIFPSYREGLSVSLMEAMASGLPCAVSRIRGNIDLIDKKGGELFDPRDISQVRRAVKNLLKRDRDAMGRYNARKIRGFGTQEVLRRLREIYASMG
ncbi:MAG: glycosyltransferase family 4 protein [Lachnospiraceae bacterium]|nr:glycosyltransferase family 4 protein [Lachnospiraceae bacterium]